MLQVLSNACVQVRSHAQKFFLKLEKCGKASVVPPPRPKKRAAKPYPVQDRSEERRKSKRSRPSNSNSSGQSVPSRSSPSGTPVSGLGGRSSARSNATAVTSLLTSSRPIRSSRLTRALSSHKGSSQEVEGKQSGPPLMNPVVSVMFSHKGRGSEFSPCWHMRNAIRPVVEMSLISAVFLQAMEATSIRHTRATMS